MIKEGPLSSIHLLQLLGEIFTERFTGAMRLESGSQVRILYFKSGDIVSCGTNVNAEKIDEVLLSLGKITRDHIREVLEMSASFSEIGKRMLSLGFLSAAELDDSLKYQTLTIVRNLIHAVDGTFSLVENYTPTRTDIFNYPTHHFISDFLRTSDDRELIFSILPPPTTRVKALPGAAALIDTLPWGAEEKGMAANLNGKVSLAELTGLSRMREMDIYKLVAALACLGVVEVVGEAEAPAPLSSPEPMALQPPVPSSEPPFIPPFESPSPALSSELFPQTRTGARPDISIPHTHTHKTRSRRLFVIYPVALIAIMLVGFGAVLAWQKLNPPRTAKPPAVSNPQPARPAPIVLKEPAAQEQSVETGPDEGESADMVLTPPAAQSTKPATGLSPAPSTSSFKPEPPKPVPSPKPDTPPAAPAPVVAPPAPKPATPVPTSPPPSGRFAAQARSHLQRIQGLPSSHLTLQLMIACQDDSIAKAQAADAGGDLWFIPFSFKGKSCYKVYWGEYSRAADAQSAVSALPESFRSGKPQVVTLGAALKNASP